MRVSLEWLQEYVDITGLKAEDIAAALTNSGLEVEHIEQSAPKFDGVVVAKVQTVEPHPNADKLRLVTVALGAERTQKVVCGAPNVREDIFIAFAQEGATVLNRKDGSSFVLGRANIRGVESAGMICSLDELGLEERFEKREDGIWPLDVLVSEAQLGQDLKAALSLGGDTVLEVAPTANRGDLMSMLGVAREVAALFDRPLRHPELPHLNPTGEPTNIRIALGDPDVCWYYGAVKMKNLKIGSSPDWMQRRLQAAGMRPISNVVDITNYVMLEIGQPLHAFDWQKLGTTGVIDVRRGTEGEKFTTLDDIERTLTPESVVVTMNNNPVALAGVMGGLETEIEDASTTLFLESAYFPPAATRRSGKSVGLRSEASARFERGVDLDTCRQALIRAAELLTQHAGAEFVKMIESPQPAVESPKLTLHLARIQHVLGMPVEADTVARVLKKLGFLLQATHQEPIIFTVEVPSFRRNDVYREIDLIEEVARIVGYDHVPYTLPRKTASVAVSLRARLLDRLHAAMQGQGLMEAVTTSLIGDSLLEKTGFTVNREQLVSVLNSHSADHTFMRQSLLPNLIEVARFNQAQGIDDVWIYELGRVYFKLGKANAKNAGVSERLSLSGLLTGSTLSGAWRKEEEATQAADFYRLKGLLENTLASLGLVSGDGDAALSFAPATDADWLHPGRSAQIKLNGKALGLLGELHPLLKQRLKFREPVFVFELNAETLAKALKQADAAVTRLSPLPQYPAVRRDMAFLAPEAVTHQAILDALRSEKEPLLQEISLFDEYRAEQLGAGNRSLAYRLTFQSSDATLTDSEVDTRLAKLKDALGKALPIQFR